MILPKKVPTIQDVARRAKVSAATVSRALSSPERVSETTRERVSDAVRLTGYTINEAARSLRRRASRTILVAFPNIGNPYYSTILDSVVHEAASRGFGVLVANRLGEDPTQWLRDYFLSNRADGMVLLDASLDVDQLHEMRTRQGKLPLVVACDEVLDARLHSVMSDNRAAAARATQHLIDLGHHRIGHIHSPARNNTVSERLLGYKQALSEAQLAIRPGWIIDGDFSLESGVAAAKTYLKLDDKPTAMFAANDEIAIGFISALRGVGIQCPRDISVIGFDDISVSRCVIPALTTMRQQRDEIGRLATKSLLDILEGMHSDADPIHIELKSPLIVRDSTANHVEPT